MLKHELITFMDVEQLYCFLGQEKKKTHKFVELPDHRVETWYEDADVYEFQTAWEALKDAESNY